MKREHSTEGKLPQGYQRLDYIQSTGTQYIDTCFPIPSSFQDFQFIMEYQRTGNFNYTHHIFGSCSNDKNWFNAYIDSNNGYKSQCYIGSTGRICWLNDNDYNEHTIDFILKSNKTCVLKHDDVQVGSSTYSGTPVSNANIYIFCSSNGTMVSSNKSKMKLFKNIMYVDSESVRHLIPALRLSDNKPGLYDLCGSICPLTNTPFYVNAGTGEFLYQ